MNFRFDYKYVKNDDEYINAINEGYAIIGYRPTDDTLKKIKELKDTSLYILVEYLVSQLKFGTKEEKALALKEALNVEQNSKLDLEIGLCKIESGDIDDGLVYVHNSANHDNPLAMYILAKFYTEGIFVQKDEKVSLDWLLKSADNGYVSAQNGAALVLMNNEETVKDAIKYLLMAEKQGLPDACCNLGLCYLFGKGVDQNTIIAINYFERAAKVNHIQSLNILSDLYINGSLVERNFKKAYEYTLKASELGDDYAKGVLKYLNDNNLR